MAFRSNDSGKSNPSGEKLKRAQTERACYELGKANEQMMSKFAFELIDCGPEQETQINAKFTVVEVTSAYLFGSDVIEEIGKIFGRDFSESARVDPRDMFKGKNIVFLAGVPGSGKSSLAHSLLREWHEGRLWDDRFDFIFFVNAAAAMSLFTTGPYTIERALRALYPGVFKYIEFSDLTKFQCLIIVDSIEECGFHETYVGGEQTAFETFIKSVVESPKNFCKIIAGNPHSCRRVHERLVRKASCQFVEVAGLSENQMRNCVSKLCNPEKTGYVLQRIEENQTLLPMARLPVFTSVIRQVLSENSSALIETRTELFVWAYVLLLTRHLNKNRPFVDTSSYEKLFNYEILLDALLKLGKMAFDMVSTGKKVFEFDKFFRATEIASAFVTPFLVHRQQSLRFLSSTFVDFFAAVHLFSTRATLDDELVNQKYLQGGLPIYFGFLGASTRRSDSPKIVRDFLQPLMKRSQILPLDKHPLCGKVGELVYTMGLHHDLFIDLCFEFGNRRLLNDRDFYWKEDVCVRFQHHHELARLSFFMKNALVADRRIRGIMISPKDEQLSIHECLHLSEVINSCARKMDSLVLSDISLNEEKMKILAPVICLVREVRLNYIPASGDEIWRILILSFEEAKQKRNLQLDRLMVVSCIIDTLVVRSSNIDESLLAQMRKFVREVKAW